MEIDDLKKAWNSYSSTESEKHQLEKDSINQMLQTKTKTLVERIDRNIRIGLLILFAYLIYLVLSEMLVNNYIHDQAIKYPEWMWPIDVFSITLIITTYLFFAIRYLKIKRNFSVDNHLQTFLQAIVDTILLYRRMFYLVIAIMIINITLAFIAGFYQGLMIQNGNTAGNFENFTMSELILLTSFGLLILGLLISVTIFLLRWGFNKLYGRYLHILNDTLKELNEASAVE
jgi:hypothetical protein